MSGFHKSCSVPGCGRRTDRGRDKCEFHRAGHGRKTVCAATGCDRYVSPNSPPYCALHALMAERERIFRHPYRYWYTTAEYRRNRLVRFGLAGGRCESCGKKLSREQKPGGEWECHHVNTVKGAGVSPNAVENLRVGCLDCHNKATAGGRRKL